MPGPRRLVDWPWVLVEVECSLCRRHGRYRLARLAERFGAEMDLAAVLRAVSARCGLGAGWAKPRPYEARCGARFLVPAGGPLPAEAPARARVEGEGPRHQKRLGSDGPPPTIAALRAQGIAAARLCCLGTWQGVTCFRAVEIPLDALALPDDAVFLHIPRLRRFRCRRCGSTRVQVLPAWPDARLIPVDRNADAFLSGDAACAAARIRACQRSKHLAAGMKRAESFGVGGPNSPPAEV